MALNLPHKFSPRSYQAESLAAFDRGCKRHLWVWHRRAGKDRTALALTSKAAWLTPGVYWHLFPELNQGRKILWDGRDRDGKPFLDAFPEAIIKRRLDQEMKIELKNGSIWQIVGVDNANALVGANPRGIVLSEWSLIDPFAWDLLRPILRENGGWAIFIFTPRGKNHAFRMFTKAKVDASWFVSVKTIADTARDSKGENGSPVLTMEDIEQERREGMSEEMIQQEYFCSFSGSLVGAYYADQMARAEQDGRIGIRPWEPRVECYTSWDLGVSDACSVGVFQSLGNEQRCIDYYEDRGKGMTGAMKWLKEKPYIYAPMGHLGPHDIKTREISTAQSRMGFAYEHGFSFTAVPKLPIDEGIDLVRRTMPTMSFDAVKCARLIDALRAYRKEWDEKNQEFKKQPLHDWSSHAADMMRTRAVGFRPQSRAPRPSFAQMEFDPMNHDRPIRTGPRNYNTDFDPFR